MKKQTPFTSSLNRRRFLQLSGLAGAGAALSVHQPWSRSSFAQSANKPPRFLIVIGCAGGANILDSVLALKSSEVDNPNIHCFPDQKVSQPADSQLRAVDSEIERLGAIPYRGSATQSEFLTQYYQNMAAITYTGTSVNHLTAQKRSLTGNDAWGGRTVQEAVAAEYGSSFLLPNINMSTGGYIEPGHDSTLPSYAQSELIASPLLWPLSLHGHKGVLNQPTPHSSIINLARSWRADQLEQNSVFYKKFKEDKRLQRWLDHRTDLQPSIEEQDLINQLLFIPESPQSPLDAFGLTGSEEGSQIRQAFPDYLTDPLEAQAALTYLLITQGISVTVTLGPNFTPLVNSGNNTQSVKSPPLAFDFSHTDHSNTQALMWSRLYGIADRLIQLLKQKEFDQGQSYWDRTLIYFATEFGRTKTRPANAEVFSSGHHLNNGALLISPLIKGNQVLGGVDPETGLTYGFDTQTGTPTPNTEMEEKHLYSALLSALDIDVSGSTLPSVPVLSPT